MHPVDNWVERLPARYPVRVVAEEADSKTVPRAPAGDRDVRGGSLRRALDAAWGGRSRSGVLLLLLDITLLIVHRT